MAKKKTSTESSAPERRDTPNTGGSYTVKDGKLVQKRKPTALAKPKKT